MQITGLAIRAITIARQCTTPRFMIIVDNKIKMKRWRNSNLFIWLSQKNFAAPCPLLSRQLKISMTMPLV